MMEPCDEEAELRGPVAAEQSLPALLQPAGHDRRPQKTILIDDHVFLEKWAGGRVPWLGGILRMGQLRRANLLTIRNPSLSECP